MEIKVYVDDKYVKEYEDALAKLVADYYKDELKTEEKEKYLEQVARMLLIRNYESTIILIAEGDNPYDYSDNVYGEAQNLISKMAKEVKK